MTTNENDRERLRQELLELHFGCHPAPEPLTARMEEDPELQALYEEVSQMAGLLETAAKDRAPELDLSPQSNGTTSRQPYRLRFGRGFLLSAAALLLVCLVPCGLWGWNTHRLHQLKQDNLRMVVSIPPAIPDGAPLRFHVETRNLADQSLRTDVTWDVLGSQNNSLARGSSSCDGAMFVDIAGNLDRPRLVKVTATQPATGQKQTASLHINPLAAAPMVYATTDKPAYRPGEPVLLRAAVLDRLTLQPRPQQSLRYRITNPRGAVVTPIYAPMSLGVVAQTWKVPADAPGGEYAFEVRDPGDKFTLERVPIFVRRFQPPKLKKDITLDQKTYTAGTSGNAEVKVSRVAGGNPTGARVHASLVVDGKSTWQEEGRIDGEGRCVFRFPVPVKVERGAARFVARITDGGVIETQLKPFVIPTEKVDVALSPEGGNLVTDIPNRVYAQVTDALERPITARGNVVDEAGEVVASFETRHQGRGRFEFTPRGDTKYRLQLTEPFEKSFDLPAASKKAVGLQSKRDVFAAGETIDLKVHTPDAGPWICGVFCRGVLVGQENVRKVGPQDVHIKVLPEAWGVLRVTVFDKRLQPVAERLIQRETDRRVAIALTPEKQKLSPGEKQKIRIKTTDETGEPVAGLLGVTVTDRAVADMLDHTHVGIADHVALLGDIDTTDLEDVDEFLSRIHKDARRNVDLLLGSLSWRRFAWQGKTDTETLVKAGGEWARSLPSREGNAFALAVKDVRPDIAEELHRARTWRSDTRDLTLGLTILSLVVLGLMVFYKLAWWVSSKTPRPVEMWLRAAAIAAPLLIVAALPMLATGLSTRLAPAEGFDLFEWPEREVVYLRDFDVELAQAAAVPQTIPDRIAAERVVDAPDASQEGRGFWEQTKTDSAEISHVADRTAAKSRLVREFANRLTIAKQKKQRQILPNVGRLGDAGQGTGQPNAPGLVFPPPNPGEILFAEEPTADPAVGGQPRDNLVAGDPFAPQGLYRIQVDPQARHEFSLTDLTLGLNQMFSYQYGEVDGRGAFDRKAQMDAYALQLVNVARQTPAFAYKHQADGTQTRSSFTETLFWHPFLLTDDKGEVSVEFDVNDSVTTWKIYADAFTRGRVGQAEAEFQVELPFHMDFKVPVEVTQGDQLQLPVAIVSSNKDDVAATLKVVAAGPLALGEGIQANTDQLISLTDGRGRMLVPVTCTDTTTVGMLAVSGAVRGAQDKVTRAIRIVPRGFPKDITRGGTIDGKTSFRIALPKDLVPGSAKATLKLYPSTLSTIQGGLSGILQEPHGCFEQTSSSNYPNTMVLSYLEASGDNVPSLVNRARQLLPRGYNKLVGYECSSRGYEWWGKNPGHDTLTAYGLMQFHDMHKVYGGVDQGMMQRTREWLLSKRDGKGGFKHHPGGLDRFLHSPAELANAYILWSLTTTGTPADQLKVELDALERRLEVTKDSYELALIACALYEAGREDVAKVARSRLASLQQKDGSLAGSATITHSGGRDRTVETTSLAVLAWIGDAEGKYTGQIHKAIDFLCTGRKGSGSFGATQATILALKALTAHAGSSAEQVKDGEIRWSVTTGDMETPRESRAFTRHQAGPTVIDLTEGVLSAVGGECQICMEITGGGKLPWTFELSYHADQPADDKDCKVTLETFLSKRVVDEGDTVALTLRVENRLPDGPLPMTMAIVGLPAGLDVSKEVLDDLKKGAQFDFYELRGREVILYWRGMAKGQQRQVVLDLTARIPGTTTGPASRAYLYYTPDQKRWAQPLKITVR